MYFSRLKYVTSIVLMGSCVAVFGMDQKTLTRPIDFMYPTTDSLNACFHSHDYKAAQDVLIANPFIRYCRDANGNIPLHRAIINKNPMAIDVLITPESTTVSNGDGLTALGILVYGCNHVRNSRRGISSPLLQAELITAVGKHCSLEELEKNLDISIALASKNNQSMKHLITISTVEPLEKLIPSKKPQLHVANVAAQNKKRKESPVQLPQRPVKKHKSVTYAWVPVDTKKNLDRMVEVSHNNILPQGTKRLRKSMGITSY